MDSASISNRFARTKKEISHTPRKGRRIIPHSNSHRENTDQQSYATQFGLSLFALGPILAANETYPDSNDDLSIEHYSPSPLSYDGAQRRGIVEPSPNASSHEEHIEAALNANFPLRDPSPLPKDLELALTFNRDNELEKILEFRHKQMSFLCTIATECMNETERLYLETPEFIKPATGKVHIAFLAHLVKFTGMQGSKWALQFRDGFPMTGKLQQSGVFPFDASAKEDFTSPDSFFATNTVRFQPRAPHAVSRHATPLWREALEQVEAGWLTAPVPLSANGDLLEQKEEKCNIVFRFGSLQADKLRGCDDLRDSMTITACTIRTPITLPGWDHIAAASRILAGTRCSWSFGKVDHKSAYKALPILPRDSRYAVIALWNPDEKRWCAFWPRTQLFGSIAAVLHYNCFSRVIATLICRLLLIPTIGYFDDFGFFARTSDEALTLAHINELVTLIGLELKVEKSVIGTHNIFLGLSAYFPSPNNGMSLVISLPRDKAHRWASLIMEAVVAKCISHSALGSLIGRLSFAQTAVFGKFARSIMKPLYIKLYPPAIFRKSLRLYHVTWSGGRRPCVA